MSRQGTQSRRFGPARKQSGFTLVELLVSLLMMIIVVVGMAAMFDRSLKITKTEDSVTDAQQSVRYASYQVVRESRMAGAGGLPASTSAGTVHQLGVSLNLGSSNWGTAAAFASNKVNVSSDSVCIGATACNVSGAHHIRVGTDILHIRGVISTPVFDLGSASWAPPGAGNTIGTLVIKPCTKFSDPTATASQPCFPNGTNDMTIFASSSTYPIDRLFVMSDSFGNVGVGAVTHTGVSTATGAKGITATVLIDVGHSATPNTTYSQTLCPNGVFPTGLTSPSRGGVIDDRVYFVDDGTTTATNCNVATSRTVQDQVPGPCHPVLSYADWATGDSAANPFSTASVTPIAEDIEDLQVAYGIDFYDLIANTGTLASPAPTRIDSVSGLPLPYPSDDSISMTTKTGGTGFDAIVAAARGATAPNVDPSEDVSAVGKDEWVGNVATEIASVTFDHLSDLTRLRALEISILAKGSTPDPLGRAPSGAAVWLGAFSWPLMDNTSPTVSQPATGVAFPFRRRVSTVRVHLRNFDLQ